MAAYIPVIGVTFNISVFMILAFLLVLQLRFKKYKASFSYALIDLEAMMFLYTVLKIIALYLRIVTDQDRTTVFITNFSAHVAHLLVFIMLFRFYVIFCRPDHHMPRADRFMAAIPALVVFILMAIPSTRNEIFFVDKNGVYSLGRLRWIIVDAAIIYVAMVIGVIIKYRKELNSMFGLCLGMNIFCGLFVFTGTVNTVFSSSTSNLVMALSTVVMSFFINTETENKLRNDNQVDALTGVRNRSGLRADFDSFCNKELWIAFGDVDAFKSFNDRYGHSCGDKVLKACGMILKENFHDTCYRYGGDEFLLIYDSPSEDFTHKMKKVIQEIGQIQIEDTSENISMTFGFTHGFAKNFADVRGLIEGADAALYEGKKTGRKLVSGSEDSLGDNDGVGAAYLFRKEERAVYEKSALAIAVYQMIDNKPTAILVSNGLCQYYQMDRSALIRYLNSGRMDYVAEEDVETIRNLMGNMQNIEEHVTLYHMLSSGSEYKMICRGRYQIMGDGTPLVFTNFIRLDEK